MNEIKEVLNKKGITQIWLADQLGKSYNMVNAYAQNRRQPSLEDLYKIADILDVEIFDLLKKTLNNKMDKIKVFEAFAGYGGASFGLKKAKIPYEVIVTKEVRVPYEVIKEVPYEVIKW